MTDNKYEGCEIEVYFDETVGCNVTVILDTSKRLSPKRQEADRKAKAKGFHDINHFEGFLYANGLFNEMKFGYDVDVLGIHS
ncbi:hypothetical protein [Escherichia phage phiWec190]|uniref:hypothetical protein n=1 Tax=Escherichia coli TaxID=562 RepID=UPI001FF1A753|nr:hypothetical protein [Escherichia coli]BDU12061.1 hypothetical protein [Escherichia phage phiWec179]BDU12579.1 hypothetical protein [Escherichia phage phiWec181]BDU12724.1 hypothetical protein [Escherichia phage phiWec186]BDU13232.1 hypothetical protein [Escherichia phage phiWec188]BDU13671.1 hypothetical protein [Escherichia phage phiWec190]